MIYHGRMYGVTIAGTDNTEDGVGVNLSHLVSALEQLPVKPTLRIVMDFEIQPATYLKYVKVLRNLGYPIMLQPVDSSDMHRYSVTGYVERFRRSLEELGNYVDYVECANEVNGDWCGSHPYDKMKAVIASVSPSFKKIVTFYVQEGFEKAMAANLPKDILYLFFSVYPNSEPRAGAFLDTPWPSFPNYVGIGEYGTEDSEGKQATLKSKMQMVMKFEGRLPNTIPSGIEDVVAGFYWDFYDDCVKNDIGLLEVFKTVWSKGSANEASRRTDDTN